MVHGKETHHCLLPMSPAPGTWPPSPWGHPVPGAWLTRCKAPKFTAGRGGGGQAWGLGKDPAPDAVATHLSADQTQVAAERQEERPAAIHADSGPGPTGSRTRTRSAPPPRPGWGAGEEGGLRSGPPRSGAQAAAAAAAAHPHGPRAPPPPAPAPSLGGWGGPGQGTRVQSRYLGGSRAHASIHGLGAASRTSQGV